MSPADPTILEGNLRALRGHRLVQAKAIEEAEPLPGVVDTDDGSFSFRLRESDGPWVASRRGPVREAERVVGDRDVKPLHPCLLIGFGNGAAAKLLLKRFPDSPVVVLEDNLRLIRTVLEREDFSKAIGQNRLGFVLDLPGAPIDDAIQLAGDAINLYGFEKFQLGYSATEPAYSLLYAELARWTKRRALELSSEFWGSRVTLDNLMLNVPHYLESAGIDSLKGLLKGVPAVVIGAGPSLQKNLHVLKEYQDKVFVIAVSSALKRVLNQGIRVDATIVVDYSHLSQRYFVGIDNPPPLFAHPRTAPETLDAYKGRKIVSDDEIYRGIFTDKIQSRGAYEGEGNNVSHFAFHTVRFLGCDPIMIIGMDLGFSAHTTHTPGTAIHDEWASSLHRFNSLEGNELSWIHVNHRNPITTTDIHGHTIHTDNLMLAAGDKFENIISKATDTRVINATEGGRALKHAEQRALRDALEECAKEEVDLTPYYDAISLDAAEQMRELEKGHQILKEAQRFGRRLDEIFSKARKALRRAEKRLANGAESDEQTARKLDQLNERLDEWRGIFTCVTMLTSADKILRQKQESELSDERIPERERMLILAKRESQYLEGLEEALQVWHQILDQSVERLAKYQEARGAKA